MVYTGKNKLLIILVMMLVLFTSLSCSRKPTMENEEFNEKPFMFSFDEVPALLSGVWYHTKNEQMNHPVEREFSWGKTTFGYWNALVIDLLNGRQLVEAADGGGDRVTYDIDNSKKNLIHMHLGLSSGGGEEATIEIITKNEIIFSYGSAQGEYYKMVNGKYYRLYDPSQKKK